MGNDGSGKTTIAKELVKIFGELGFEVIYKHEYEYAILRILFKLIGQNRIEKSRKEMIVEKKKSWKYYLWPLLVWFDILLQYIYFKIFKRKSVIILDRYLYDHYMSFKYLGHLTRFTEWLYLHSPRPDFAIVLWVEPEVAYERKKDTHNYSVNFYRTQTERYLKLAEKLRLPSVNTNKNLKETLEEILNIVWGKRDLRKKIIRKGFQNKTYFEIFRKLERSLFWKKYKTMFNKRKEQFENTIKVLLKLFRIINVNKEYIIFKEYENYLWIGNDIDILLPYDKFKKLLKYLRQESNIKYNYNSSHVPPSIDLNLGNNFLPLDIHPKVGWRGTEIIEFKDLVRVQISKNKFGVEYYGVKPEVNAYIFSLSHLFEKGFIPKLEFEIILKYIEKLKKINACLLNFDKYNEYLGLLQNKSYKEYPIFIPITLVWKAIWSVLSKKKLSITKKLKITTRIILLQIFWRIRYKLKGTLPFEVNYHE